MEDDIELRTSLNFERKIRYYYTLELLGEFSDDALNAQSLIEIAYMRPYTFSDLWKELGLIESML